MMRTHAPSLKRVCFLLVTAGGLLFNLCQRAVAQQEISVNEETYLVDNGGLTYVYGYAEVQASEDAAMLYTAAETYMDYDGGNSSWYGAAVTSSLEQNDVEVDSDSQSSTERTGTLRSILRRRRSPATSGRSRPGTGTTG